MNRLEAKTEKKKNTRKPIQNISQIWRFLVKLPMRFSNLPLRIKLPLSFAFVICVFTGLTGYSLFLMGEMQSKHETIRQSDLAVQEIYQFTHGVREKYLIAENLRDQFLDMEIQSFAAVKEKNLDLVEILRTRFTSDRDHNMFLELERLNAHIDEVFTEQLIPIVQNPEKRFLVNIPMSELKNSMNQIDNICDTLIRLATANNEELVVSIHHELNTAKLGIYYAMAGVLVITLAFSVFLSRGYALRLRHLLRISRQVSSGDLSVRIAEEQAPDELGELTAGFGAMVSRLREMIHQIKSILREVHTMSREIQTRTNQSQDDAGQVLSTMLNLKDQSTLQMNEMELTTQWSDTIHSHLQETIAQLFENNREAEEVTSLTDQGHNAIRQIMQWVADLKVFFANTYTETERLTQLTEQIQTISTTVRAIATQTNLLSLNASIEAARSGSAGAGFTVVANEIKHLATQADHSTQEIHQLLQNINGEITRLKTQMSASLSEAESGMEKILQTGDLFAQIQRLNTQMGEGLEDTTRHGETVAQLNENMAAKITELHQVSNHIFASLRSAVNTVEDQKGRLEQVFSLIPQLDQGFGHLSASIDQFTI